MLRPKPDLPMPTDTYSTQDPLPHDFNPPGNTREVTRFGPPSELLPVARASYSMHAAPPYAYRRRRGRHPRPQCTKSAPQLLPTAPPPLLPEVCERAQGCGMRMRVTGGPVTSITIDTALKSMVKTRSGRTYGEDAAPAAAEAAAAEQEQGEAACQR